MTHLECSLCSRKFEAGKVHNLCDCGGPLLVRYDLEKLRRTWSRDQIASGPNSMWRYGPVLPPTRQTSIISLGEGMTPLVGTSHLGQRVGANQLWLKDEGLNPTGSFKARGLILRRFDGRRVGNSRRSPFPPPETRLAPWRRTRRQPASRRTSSCRVTFPRQTSWNVIAYGAHVTLVDGLISDCAKLVAAGAEREGWFDVTTLKEPYRIEGKKTMGYELAEQMDWQLPDAIFYPTGGGVGLIGMWKAFNEMEALGWIGAKRPKMIAVQVEGCQPVVRAFEKGAERSEFWENAHTVASGLRVPKPLGDFLILKAVRESGGTAIAVSDTELLDAGIRLASEEGLFIAPEGAACIPALEKLLANGFLKKRRRSSSTTRATG